MDIVEALKTQIAENPVLLFMKGTPDFPQCGFSAKTVAAVKECDVEFAFINILEHPEAREELKKLSNWPTYPQLYVGGELVGGCDIIVDLYEQQQLKPLIDDAIAAKQA